MRLASYIQDVFLTARFYRVMALCVMMAMLSFPFPLLLWPARILAFLFCVLLVAEYMFLFFSKAGLRVQRNLPERMSLGDEHLIPLTIQSGFPWRLHADIIDELPFQFEERHFSIKKILEPGQAMRFRYAIRPVERGVFSFGNTIVFLSGIFRLLSRRFSMQQAADVAVYPSFRHFRTYELMAESTRFRPEGSRKIRAIGQSLEFEQIREYVAGDDIRSVNWKATARKGGLMVNQYMQERAQQVYALIDKGRLMKMPFEGLSLLDYAINSTLAFAHIALRRQDKFGIISFAEKPSVLLAADRHPMQREKIMQALYKEETGYLEPDFEQLYFMVRQQIPQRSLLMLYSNFETLQGLRRQLPYLRSLAKYHLLIVVFFENTELTALTGTKAKSVSDVYVQATAAKFVFEKKQIVRELQQYGIRALLTTPQQLSVDAINQYLEIKLRQAL